MQTLGQARNCAPRPRPALPRILVVEDQMAIAMLIEDAILELNCTVAGMAPDIAAAMRFLDAGSFDCALLDVHLNGRTVFGFAAALAARDIPFLFATAFDPHGIPDAYRSRMVLQKPFGPAELRRALGWLIRRAA